MSIWSGNWTGVTEYGHDRSLSFSVTARGLLTPYTLMEKDSITDITHLTGSKSVPFAGGNRDIYYDMKLEGDEYIDSYRYSNEPWRVERLHRTSRSTPIDPLTMVDEVNSW